MAVILLDQPLSRTKTYELMSFHNLAVALQGREVNSRTGCEMGIANSNMHGKSLHVIAGADPEGVIGGS